MKRVHLICNAHLDPIWQWTWDEGISAVIATFKSAADLAEEFDYIFCHGEALLYEMIEKNAPDLFARIQALVKQGKWHISGGWYLQPDCLMPSGETFLRHISVGKEYFREKFGVENFVATNYDSFGHSVGLVQILAKSGYKGYLICRPAKDSQIDYPSRFFKWTSPDGSSIVVSHSSCYNSALGQAAGKIEYEVSARAVGMLGAEKTSDEGQEMQDIDYVLWGVGNHGGGPSRKDLRDIANLKIQDTELIHSSPEALFSDNLNVVGEKKTSLITCMPGCYSSMARVKQAYRRAENLFYATEKMLTVSSLAGLKVDYRDFAEAQKKLLLASFHDILPGSCIEEGEKEGLGLLSSCEKTMKEYRTQAFLYLVMNQPCAKEGEYPVFVFNYLPYEVTMPMEVEFTLADQNWSEEFCYTPRVCDENGNELSSQLVKEDSTLNLDWRKRIVFEGTLKPLSITRFSVRVEATPIFGKQTYPVSLEEVIPAPALLDAYEDTADPWGMSAEELKSVGKNPTPFRLATEKETGEICGVKKDLSPVRIIEDGAVVKTVESVYTLGNTSAILQYKLYKNQPYMDIKATIEYGDKNTLIRLKLPIPEEYKDGASVGDGPFVWEEKPSTEITFQRWVGVQNGATMYAVINDGVYAGKVEDGYIHLTLLRGSGYCMHPIGARDLYPTDRYLPRIENGRYIYNIRLFTGKVDEVEKMAQAFNEPPYAMNIFPTGGQTKAIPVQVDGKVTLTTAKAYDDGDLFRLYNPCDSEEKFTVTLATNQMQGLAAPREVVTVLYKDGAWEIVHDTMPV